MASADFLQFVVTAVFGFSYLPSARPPRVRTTTFLPCNRHIYRTGFGQHWTLCWIAHSSVPVRPTMRFLFAGSGVCPPRFLTLTSDFLQIPPRDGHPCLRLTLSTAERVVVFHHLVVTHAGRTSESGDAAFGISVGCVPAFFLCFVYTVGRY